MFKIDLDDNQLLNQVPNYELEVPVVIPSILKHSKSYGSYDEFKSFHQSLRIRHNNNAPPDAEELDLFIAHDAS